MNPYAHLTPQAREKLAVFLMTAFLLGWIAVSMIVAIVQIGHYGYGSGITNRQHLPVEVKQEFGRPDAQTPQQLMNETSR